MSETIAQRCLFITSTRLGDAVLSTGLLEALHHRHPDARITVVCGALPAPLFKAVPYVDEIVPLRKQKGGRHWIDLWKILWGTKWTAIVDLRNSLATRLLRRKRLYAFHGAKNQHKIRQFQQVLKLQQPPSPKLYLPDDSGAETLIPDGAKILALGPASNWHAKTWPEENFIELTKRLLKDRLKGWRVAVFAAEPERDQVKNVLAAFPDAIDAVGWGDPLQVAAALSRCHLFIGNDSGLMHIAAAVGIKTIGLFGPTHDSVYGPWNGHVVRTKQSVEELLAIPDYDSRTCPNLMTSLSVDEVESAVISRL